MLAANNDLGIAELTLLIVKANTAASANGSNTGTGPNQFDLQSVESVFRSNSDMPVASYDAKRCQLRIFAQTTGRLPANLEYVLDGWPLAAPICHKSFMSHSCR